ncbi:DUF2271 domain-containing protein [Ferrimonas lipolytica]|uniref:DUF2271 domain-containing protein n=1 Tax=Ferrimonas lipolytica TaxID=2724191 RepID=A0A6H1UE14_9GAMM|nr:DUF2271 domain-containing protein [Ferrimonas lipolytica]QIZ77068.1 DUF2271 domain-containing protein [Ferrimonas lipolytica]
MKFPLACAAMLLSTSTIAAPLPSQASLTIDLAINDLKVANPAKPYVAVWLEDANKKPAAQWALWTGNQTEWLKDIRTWWRKFGRYNVNEIDGYSSATRAIGEHSIKAPLQHLDGSELQQGQYTLYIEAVREHGGRDIVRQKLNLGEDAIQFTIPAKAELGQITINYKVQ